jgi:hypothetical protein
MLLDAGATPEQLRVDVGLKRMKPLLVKWMMTAWKLLRTRDAMIRKGWAKAGLGDVMNADVQKEAMKQALSRQLLSAHAEGQEDEPEILANSVPVELEDEMENDDDDIEDDEEELDIDVCLAAAVEDKPMVGIRRSARLSANAEERRSLRVAQLLQEQTEEEAVYIM